MPAWMTSIYGMVILTVLVCVGAGESDRSRRFIYLTLALVVLALTILLAITSFRESASQTIVFFQF
jgi:uncharacterized membrane protein SirB2